MLKYMSGLVRDHRSSHHMYATCWPLMMQTTQVCTALTIQMMKEVEIARLSQRTPPSLRSLTLSHSYHLWKASGNLLNLEESGCKVISIGHHHHVLHCLHQLRIRVQLVFHHPDECLCLLLPRRPQYTFLVLMPRNSALGNVQGILECTGSHSPGTMPLPKLRRQVGKLWQCR
jgi:hypothetical protein